MPFAARLVEAFDLTAYFTENSLGSRVRHDIFGHIADYAITYNAPHD